MTFSSTSSRFSTLLFTILILLMVTSSLSAAKYVVTVADFEVQTNDEEYAFVGKGIAALLANELRQSRAINLVEREKLNRLFHEHELSLSGVTEGSVQLGEVLDADLIIIGEILDMGNNFLVDVRVVDIETGEIIWSDSITEKLRRYDYIGAYFAEGILSQLEIEVVEETRAKVEEEEDKDEKALIAISEGIEAYDQGDNEVAIENFETAREIDPSNRVASDYLSRIQTISPRYRVDIFQYLSPVSAASLPLFHSMKIHTWMGVNFDPPWAEKSALGNQLVDGFGVVDQNVPFYSGVTFPLGKRLGVGLSFYYLYLDLATRHPSDPTWFEYNGDQAQNLRNPLHSMGGILSLGYKVTPEISTGISLSLGSNENFQDKGSSDVLSSGGDITEEGFVWGICPSFIWIPQWNSFVLSTEIGFNSQAIYYSDPDTGDVYKGVQPLIWDSNFTYGPLWEKLFLSMTSTFDFYIDERGGHGLRLTPLVEFWPFEWISLRAGYEYSHLWQQGSFVVGNGFVIGSTVKIWKIDLNLNFASRNRPVQLLPGSLMNNIVFMAGIEIETGLLQRKQ